MLIIFVYFFMYNFIYVLLAGASAEEIVCGGYEKFRPMLLKVFGGGGGGRQVSKKFSIKTATVLLSLP